MQYGLNETEHDIRWLTDMLAAEESGRGTAKKKKSSAARERVATRPRRPRSANRTPKGLVDNPTAPRAGLPSAQGKPAGL
jgi:hypothetical protein